jgi:FlgD Ig-like domain
LPRLAVTALVLALIGGTTAAFTLTEALKLQRSPIGKPRIRPFFSPTCECPTSTARMLIRLKKEDRLDAVVVNSDGDPVRTLASGVRESPGKVIFTWDGRTDAGAVAPDGAYRLRVHLDEEHRTIVIPNTTRLDTEPPTAELVSLAPRILSPDGDGRRDSTTLVISLGERSRPVVLVDGTPAEEGRRAPAGESELRWPGTRDGRPLREGTYVVGVQARDPAGNLSPPSSGLTVRLRYILLGRDAYRVRRAGTLRFRVSTDAARFTWRLLRAGKVVLRGKEKAPVMSTRLPERIERGRYKLEVVANGHRADAAVIVRPR